MVVVVVSDAAIEEQSFMSTESWLIVQRDPR